MGGRWVATFAFAALSVGAPAASAAPDARASACRPGGSSDQSLPHWARQRSMTVFVDSVLLGAFPTLRREMPCWQMTKRGRPALMVRMADAELRSGGFRVAPLVVSGLAYNTLFEKRRRRYRYWATRFDRDLAAFRRTLRARGAQQIVWVTLRQPTPATVPPLGRRELHLYSWYFPWVNERLRRFDRLHDDVSLADWRTASDRPGVTYDSIHTTTEGSRLMAKTIENAIRDEAARQRR